jgi:8-oxo-dGTP diphosphatase
MIKPIHVAVAILQKKNGDFLLASRPQGKGWAGWWEFPGGKIEEGEAPEHALTRELQEELGVTPTDVQTWILRNYYYPATHDAEAKTVQLHFFFVWAWEGDVQPLEGQTLAWQSPKHIQVAPILPANAPIMHALALPDIYAISNVEEMGKGPFLKALALALNQGLQLLQIREKHLNDDALSSLTHEILTLCAPYETKVLLNADIAIARKLGVHGIHLNSVSLMQMHEKPSNLLVAASCHDANQLAKAEQLMLDFAVLSPVLQTRSHPSATTLGWTQFKQLLMHTSLPVYALGGMMPADLPTALHCGARGIAMQRGAWQS